MTTFSDAQLLNLTAEQLTQLTPDQLARRQDLIDRQRAEQRAASEQRIMPAPTPIKPRSGL